MQSPKGSTRANGVWLGPEDDQFTKPPAATGWPDLLLAMAAVTFIVTLTVGMLYALHAILPRLSAGHSHVFVMALLVFVATRFSCFFFRARGEKRAQRGRRKHRK